LADLLTPIRSGTSIETGLAEVLKRLVAASGATAGVLTFTPPRLEPFVVTAPPGRRAALHRWLAEDAGPPVAAVRLEPVASSGPRGRVPDVVLRAPLGTQDRPVGVLTLFGPRPVLTPATLPSGLLRDVGAVIEQGWSLHRQALRLAALDGVTRLLATAHSMDEVLGEFGKGLASLVRFDTVDVCLVDPSRHDFEIMDVLGGGMRGVPPRSVRRPLPGTLVERVVATATPVIVNDTGDGMVPTVSRQALGASGYRSVLLVPLAAGGSALGVVTLASCRPAAFAPADADIVTELAQPLASALVQRQLRAENARLFEESGRRAAELHALVEAARAVTAPLDMQRTVRVILEQARSVLRVESCGLFTLDPMSRDLIPVASLDLAPEVISSIRLREGQGITGLAVKERRPVQSSDLLNDPRAGGPQVARTTGFRSILSAPLRLGDRVIGAISALRRDVHHFSAEQEALLIALADQAAIALEHARLYQQLEGMVTERTRELDQQRRFVEVVLEQLPLGVFVLDPSRRIVRVNREGVRLFGEVAREGNALADVLPVAEPFVEEALGATRISTTTEELTGAAEPRALRLTVAPFEPVAGAGGHAVLMVEDVTRAKQLERQMLLTERLTTAGRLAAGVAHELNNPLATIAGCAESLQARLREGEGDRAPELGDFPTYLGLIEEETYRCKEITSSLLQFVREPGSRRAPTDLNTVIVKTVELLSHQSRYAASDIVPELDPDLPTVVVNEGQLRQVFLGLAANALDAMEGRGRLTVRSRQRRGHVEIEFEDEGPGIPEDILGRIFDPFFTTKPPGQGTGLGLAIAQGLAADHDGRIEVASRVGKGSTFRVVLPT
jgi:two-component system NtrC family sensor kinase